MTEQATGREGLFERDESDVSLAHRRVHGGYERLITLADFIAALSFVVGSVMFFFEAWRLPGTWAFLTGSILFAVSPSLKVARAYHLGQMSTALREEAARKAERAARGLSDAL